MAEYGVQEIEKNQNVSVKDLMNKEDNDKLRYILGRQQDMEEQRGKQSYQWDIYDEQVKSEVPDTKDGKTNVNMPLEQNIIELYLGLKTSLLSYRVVSDGEVDGVILELNRHLLDHFIKKEDVLKELKRYYYDKAKYGYGILMSGVWFDTQIMPEGNEYFNTNSKVKFKDVYHIGVKNIPIRKIWFDEKSLTSDDAMDCIYQEDVSIEEFRLRYANKEDKGFKYVMSVGTNGGEEVGNAMNRITTKRNVMVWHYFNKLSGTYAIVANKDWLIYNGKTTTKHGQLPFVGVQHYIRTDNLYGFGVCEKLASVKPYINALLKVGIDNAWVNSGRVIAMGNDTEIDGEYFVNPGDINIWKFNGDIDKGMKEIPAQAPIIQWIQTVISLIEDYGIQNTGMNLKAPYTSPASTAFEAGMMIEQQNARVRTVDEDNNIGIEKVLTIMLCNIHQFGSTLYTEYLYDERGQLKDAKPYKVKIEGKKVEKNPAGELSISDDVAETYFFDLDDNSLFDGEGLKVTIETPTTQSLLPSLEKQEFTDALNQAILIKQMFPDANIGTGDERWDRFQKIRGFDIKTYNIKTKQDKMRQQQNDIMQTIQNFVQQPAMESQGLSQPNPGISDMNLPANQGANVQQSNPQQGGVQPTAPVQGQDGFTQ